MTWGYVAVAGATLAGSLISSNQSKQAAKGQKAAVEKANSSADAQYLQSREDSAPWRNTGAAATQQLATLVGLTGYNDSTKTQDQSRDNFDSAAYLAANPDVAANAKYGNNAYQHWLDFGNGEGRKAYWKTTTDTTTDNTKDPNFGLLNKNFSLSDFQEDPGYQSRLSEGAKALERSASAKGTLLGGGTLKALTRYNQGQASQEYGDAYNRWQNNRATRFNQLATLAGIGQTSNGQVMQLGQNNAMFTGNNLMGAANAQAAANIAGANATTSAINNATNNWMTYMGYK